MSKCHLRRMVGVVLSAVVASCSGLTEPLHTDVDAARQVWLSSRPLDYRFEVTIRSSCCEESRNYGVQVADGPVVAATDSEGTPVTNFTLTLDVLWDWILNARARGELNSALFNDEGVPIESDIGPWPLDGGVHHSVRAFVRTR